MKTSDMIRQLCDQMNISVSELTRRLGQSPQNFGKKLRRETITLEELKAIADVMDVKLSSFSFCPMVMK
ncbi:helix-turn-helix domain-containing protein [Desulfitobacterium hafniense]|uniref:helix-turn-helix domain-containing protein n=1 Tax=Desulfitobacterium hafniense TaxID=49338 RepID=UPI003D049E97